MGRGIDNYYLNKDIKRGRYIMQDEFVKSCPYCDGTEMIECYQSGYASVTAVDNMWGGVSLCHSICRNCGSVVRSYVREPEKLLKRKDRR